MKTILFLGISAGLLASCAMQQNMGEEISIHDYLNNERPSDQSKKEAMARDKAAVKAERANRTHRHGIDAVRNKLEDIGYSVSDKFRELTGSEKDWEPKLMEFHSMKIMSKKTQRHGSVSITLHPLSRAPIDLKNKLAPRNAVSYTTRRGTLIGYQTALRQGMVLAKFSIKNATNDVLRPDLKTRMVITFEGKDKGVRNFNAHVSGNYASGTTAINKPETLGFDGEYFPPKTNKDVVVGMIAPKTYERVERNGAYHIDHTWHYFSSNLYSAPLQISLYGMPVKVNDAGIVVKRANFTWTLHHRIDVWNALVKKHNLFTAMFAKEKSKLVSYKETILLSASGKKTFKTY